MNIYTVKFNIYSVKRKFKKMNLIQLNKNFLSCKKNLYNLNNVLHLNIVILLKNKLHSTLIYILYILYSSIIF